MKALIRHDEERRSYDSQGDNSDVNDNNDDDNNNNDDSMKCKSPDHQISRSRSQVWGSEWVGLDANANKSCNLTTTIENENYLS
eukprot:scaffold1190_cov187-Ochromonas_danica.AAC.28